MPSVAAEFGGDRQYAQRLTIIMRLFFHAAIGAAVLLLTPSLAQAAPGNTTSRAGTAAARIIRPISIVPIASLRFGVIARPSTAGTVTVSPASVVTTTGGMIGSNAINQGALAARAGTFTVAGEPGATFGVILPPTTTVSAPGGTMIINLFTVGALAGSAAGTLNIAVGGTLAVNANQAIGSYSGTYQITAAYQ